MNTICWALIRPDGSVLADSHFEDEIHAWEIGLGWPGRGEILQAKKEGYRVKQVEITKPGEVAALNKQIADMEKAFLLTKTYHD